MEFKPAAAGALTASLSIADNATGSPQTVTLTGTGAAAAAPAITLTPTSIAFPATVTAATSAAQVVTVKNTGTAAATISSIALGGTNATSFVEIGTCGTSLAAGASCSIYVAFKPASAAALTGTLSVTDNATGSPQKVTLTGTGTAAPTLTLSATSLAFPTTTHATTSAAQAVTSDQQRNGNDQPGLDYAGGDQSGGLRGTEYMRGDVGASGDLPGVCRLQTGRRGSLHGNLEHYR